MNLKLWNIHQWSLCTMTSVWREHLEVQCLKHFPQDDVHTLWASILLLENSFSRVEFTRELTCEDWNIHQRSKEVAYFYPMHLLLRAIRIYQYVNLDMLKFVRIRSYSWYVLNCEIIWWVRKIVLKIGIDNMKF